MKKLILSLILAFTINNQAANASFIDVNEDTKYSEAIGYLQEQGIINGYADGTFKPDNTLSRAELLKILIEANVDNDELIITNDELNNCFPDVRDEWFAPYVCYAKEKGIIGGYADGTFKPAQKVNFVEALKILFKTEELDYDEQSDPWYKDIVNTASENRLIPFDIVSFNQNLNRGQISDMMTRRLKEENEELDIYLRNTNGCEVTYESIFNKKSIEDECFVNLILTRYIPISELEKGRKKTKVVKVAKDLEKANLSYNSIEEVRGLEKLENLRVLDLGGNEIWDLTFLQNLINLQELDLRNNWVGYLQPLENLNNLEKLNLNLNLINHINYLASLNNLKWLGLYHNKYIDDLSALNDLPNIAYVDLGEIGKLDEETIANFQEDHTDIEIAQDVKGFIGKQKIDFRNILEIRYTLQDSEPTQEEVKKVEQIVQQISNDLIGKIKLQQGVTQDDIDHLNSPLITIKPLDEYNTFYLTIQSKVNPALIAEEIKNNSEMQSNNHWKISLYEDDHGVISDEEFDDLRSGYDYKDDVISISFKQERIDPSTQSGKEEATDFIERFLRDIDCNNCLNIGFGSYSNVYADINWESTNNEELFFMEHLAYYPEIKWAELNYIMHTSLSK